MIACLIVYLVVTIVEKSGQNIGLVIDTYSLHLSLNVNAMVRKTQLSSNLLPTDNGSINLNDNYTSL